MTAVPAAAGRPGEAAAVEAAERAVFDAWAVREGDLPTADASWWAIHRSGPTHSKWAADAAVAAAYPVIAEAVRADEREKVLGTFTALIADERALDDESFFYASLDDVQDFVTEVAARLAAGGEARTS